MKVASSRPWTSNGRIFWWSGVPEPMDSMQGGSREEDLQRLHSAVGLVPTTRNPADVVPDESLCRDRKLGYGRVRPPPPSMTTVLPEEALHSARFQGNTDPNSVGRLDASFFFLHRCAHSRPSCHSRAAFLRFPSSDQETAGMHHTLPSHNLSQRPKAWVCSLEPAFAPTSSQGRTGCSGPKLLNIS